MAYKAKWKFKATHDIEFEIDEEEAEEWMARTGLGMDAFIREFAGHEFFNELGHLDFFSGPELIELEEQ